jgi:catechol 2,3-dioxygenase-like lactoylglutathione lyase family enzyme
MLANRNVMASIAVKDIDAARRFYGEVLGLRALESEQAGVLSYQSGTATLIVYVSEFAATNKATSATWGVGEEFDDILETLKARGVAFEHYDLAGLTLVGDAHVAGDFKGAWFKDPDDNILHILNR